MNSSSSTNRQHHSKPVHVGDDHEHQKILASGQKTAGRTTSAPQMIPKTSDDHNNCHSNNDTNKTIEAMLLRMIAQEVAKSLVSSCTTASAAESSEGKKVLDLESILNKPLELGGQEKPLNVNALVEMAAAAVCRRGQEQEQQAITKSEAETTTATKNNNEESSFWDVDLPVKMGREPGCQVVVPTPGTLGNSTTTAPPTCSTNCGNLSDFQVQALTAEEEEEILHAVRQISFEDSSFCNDDDESLSEISGITHDFAEEEDDEQEDNHRHPAAASQPKGREPPKKEESSRSRGRVSSFYQLEHPSGSLRSILEQRDSSSVATNDCDDDKEQGNGTAGKNKKKKRSVSFGVVHVRYYERILSDNPGSRSGPSIGLGWNYHPADSSSSQDSSTTIDEWEMKNRRVRCGSGDLQLGRREREKLLLRLGYTEREIAKAVREANKARFQRRQSANNACGGGGVRLVEEILEGAKKMLFLKKSKKG